MIPGARVFEGGCHCGAVRFRTRVRSFNAIDCNCGICAKKGFLHLIVPEDDFELLRGDDVLSTYTFGTHTAKHYFCNRCGIHSFYRPRSHPDKIDVNVRCLEGVTLDAFDVTKFDGQNWEREIDTIRD